MNRSKSFRFPYVLLLLMMTMMMAAVLVEVVVVSKADYCRILRNFKEDLLLIIIIIGCFIHCGFITGFLDIIISSKVS